MLLRQSTNGRHMQLKIESWRNECAVKRNESEIGDIQELVGDAALAREHFQVKQPPQKLTKI